ncbi:hypothetical protein C6502_16845 [Candidatus Poribacteria bacterium]|nr:MAG: hypothetical protein C6502_16845 [Candidatus Poribacteria bacterium]
MVWLIAKKEIYDNWQSHKIILTFALCIILLMMSVWLGLIDYSERLLGYNLTRNANTFASVGKPALTYVFFDEAGKLNPNSTTRAASIVNLIGIYRRPVGLSILARGLEDRMNRPVRLFDVLGGYTATIDTSNSQEKNKLFVLFSPPDFLFVVKVVLSLLTILFTFSAIAGEREQGTLQLMLSNSVSRGQMLLGKFLGGYLSIVIPFLVAVLIALFLLARDPLITFGGENWLRILLLLITSLAYIALFFFIGLYISALTQRAATAAVLLLAIWVILTLVVPNVGWLVAKQVVRVPSQQQIDTEKFKTAREIEDDAERSKPSGMFVPGYGKFHPEVQPQIEEARQEIEERYAKLRQKRLRLSQIVTRFSPTGAYVHAATGLAQTSIEDEEFYHSQLVQHKTQLDATIKETFALLQKPEKQPLIYQNLPQEPRALRDRLVKINSYEGGTVRNIIQNELSFTFDLLSLPRTLNAIWLDLSLLVLWLGFSFVFAMLAIMKCRVRQ